MSKLADRIDRLESVFAIQQLAIRYALAVDGRDIDAWLALFVDDVDCGRRGKGREALRTFIEPALTAFYRSVHLICGHRIDFTDSDHATGEVYCRAEHEDGTNWMVMAIRYADTYERRHGSWFFIRRAEEHWYATDHLSRPAGPTFNDWPGQAEMTSALPGAFPAWRGFWSRQGAEAVAKRTLFPVD